MRAGSYVHWTRETHGAAAADDIQIHKCLENTHPLYRFGVGLYNRIQRHSPGRTTCTSIFWRSPDCTPRATGCWAWNVSARSSTTSARR